MRVQSHSSAQLQCTSVAGVQTAELLNSLTQHYTSGRAACCTSAAQRGDHSTRSCVTKFNWHCVTSQFSQSAAATSTCGHVVKLQQLGSTHGVTRLNLHRQRMCHCHAEQWQTHHCATCGSGSATLVTISSAHCRARGVGALHEYSGRFNLWGHVCTGVRMTAVPVYVTVPCAFHTASRSHVPGFTAAPRMPGKSWSHTSLVASDGVPAPLAQPQPRRRGQRGLTTTLHDYTASAVGVRAPARKTLMTTNARI